MKGEKELIEKILNTEINIFLAIRDGSALMQHMEDFYYITLLEVLAFSTSHFEKYCMYGIDTYTFLWFPILLQNVRSNYKTVPRSQLAEERNISIG